MDTLLVEKESIPTLSFSNKSSVQQHPNLRKQIDKATILGNIHRRKVSIVFEDDHGTKRVDTTIWACLLYTSPSPRDRQKSRMPSSA